MPAIEDEPLLPHVLFWIEFFMPKRVLLLPVVARGDRGCGAIFPGSRKLTWLPSEQEGAQFKQLPDAPDK